MSGSYPASGILGRLRMCKFWNRDCEKQLACRATCFLARHSLRRKDESFGQFEQ